MCKTFLIYFKFGIRSIFFFIAVLLVPFACFISANPMMFSREDKILFQEMFSLSNEFLSTDIAHSSISIFTGSFYPHLGLFLPLVAAFPSVILYCEGNLRKPQNAEVKNRLYADSPSVLDRFRAFRSLPEELRGFNKLEIFRTGKKHYIAGRILAAALLAFCAAFIGLMLLYGVLNFKFPNVTSYNQDVKTSSFSFWYFCEYTKVLGGALYVAAISAFIGLLSAVVAIFCMCVATFVPSKFFALGMPVVIFKITSNIVMGLYGSPLRPVAPFMLNLEQYVQYPWAFIKPEGGSFPFWVYPTVVFSYGILFTFICIFAFCKKMKKP